MVPAVSVSQTTSEVTKAFFLVASTSFTQDVLLVG
eukprot:jgi/Antlo1/2026/1004